LPIAGTNIALRYASLSPEVTPCALYFREWRRRRRLARHGVCVSCRTEFAGKRIDARYCWHGCKQRAWRLRTAARLALAMREATMKAEKARRLKDWAASLIG
jgi:hypothetical protein